MARYIANPDYTDFVGERRGVFPGSILVGGTIGFFKDIIQGMCAGAMMFVGVLSSIGADLSILPNLPLERFVDNALNNIAIGEFVASPYAGPVEIVIGAALFLTARRGIARTLGLLGVIFYISAVATGVDLSRFTAIAGDLFANVEAGWAYLQALQDASGPQPSAR